MKKLLLIALLLIPQYALARTIASDGSQANIQSIINDAGTVAGDIIAIPGAAGSPQTFHWTGVLDVTKAVTIKGGSVIHNPGTKVCTAADNTIIIDDVNSSLTHLIQLHTGSRNDWTNYLAGNRHQS